MARILYMVTIPPFFPLTKILFILAYVLGGLLWQGFSLRPQKISRHFPFVFSFRNADDRHDSMSTATWRLPPLPSLGAKKNWLKVSARHLVPLLA